MVVMGCWMLAFLPQAQAAPLMEEGFNYLSGTGLAANLPWSGSSGSSISVVSGNLTLTNLQGTVPAGNLLQIGGGTSRTCYRNFSSNTITGGAVYFSTLIRCTLLPTNSQFIASLMSAGNTSPNQPDDPLDLYVTTATNGYTFRVSHTGDDPVTVRKSLAVNSTHFIVMKYTFGSGGQASIYLDPAPGGTEPATPDARTSNNEGSDAANLQMVLFRSPSSAAQGTFNFDTLRIATNWPDATPMPTPLSLSGPQDQAVCFGGSAMFSVLAAGTPPFTYRWRTNGVAIINATNNNFALNTPVANDVLSHFDVMVYDTFGAVTSRVAKLSFSTNAAFIVSQPVSQLVTPGVSNVTFSVTAAGDAPVSHQWRVNGITVPGATNTSYTFYNPGSADATNAIDVVASNPCGSATSSPPVGVYFPNSFYTTYDAGAGFFSGENVIFTNTSGINFYVWSSPDLSVSLTNWTLEGPMSELPLGTSGYSRYGINLNPVTSPVYYIFATTNTGPYTATEPVVWLTTADFASFTVTSSNFTISASGFLNQNTFYAAYDAGAGFFSGENVIFTNTGGISFNVWSSPDLSVSVTNWTLEGPMSELPFGTSGESRYGINLNPVTSPVYYIFAPNNTGPYTSTEALVWLTTSYFSSFIVVETNMPIGADGIFVQQLPITARNTFAAAYDAGTGFFGGENLVFTGASGTSFYVWSSSDPSASVKNWTLEGAMSEFPLGAAGDSRYGINLNPGTSPEYYIFAQTNVGPYFPTEALVWLASSDFSGFAVVGTNATISADGVFALPALPSITQLPVSKTALAGQNPSFSVTATGPGLGFQWFYSSSRITGASAPALNLTNVSMADAGYYIVTITNLSGAAISSFATLTVAAPPNLNLEAALPGTSQLSANSITGLTYVVQTATNLINPIWVPIATNNTGTGGGIHFQTNAVETQLQFYRLVFP